MIKISRRKKKHTQPPSSASFLRGGEKRGGELEIYLQTEKKEEQIKHRVAKTRILGFSPESYWLRLCFFFGGGVGLWVGDGGGGWMFNGHGEKGNRVFMPFPAMPGPREDQVQCLGRGRGRAGGGGAAMGAPRRGGGPGAFFFFFFFSADANFWSGERESLGRGMAWLLVVGRRGEGSRLMTH